jgi:ABC-type transport system substrate-binding protein
MESGGWKRFGFAGALLVGALMLLSVVPVAALVGPVSAPAGHAGPSVTSAAHSTATGTSVRAGEFGPVTTKTTASPSVKSFTGAGPHPGTLEIYEAAGGGTTVDPASAYYTVNAEPIWNVYETLIAYNGSSTSPLPSGFVPQLSTCVPGSAECQLQYGTNLAFANATNPSTTQYYTFEIDANARFYDPATHSSWPVYPSDVLFSFARTMAFANLPGVAVYPGWIQSQALLPSGSSSWDGGIHSPYNNTPAHVLSSILVNDSAYCPAPSSGSLHTNGCVTFNVGPSGLAWPYFLELIADPMGGSVEPCGTFTYLGATVPGFTGTTAANGDGACKLPGGATSSTQSSFQNYLHTVSPTLWDSMEEAGARNYPSAQPAVQSTMIGSGPYYATSVDLASGYFLKANPAYHVPVGCAGLAGCLPAPGGYIPNVNVYWSNSDTLGLQEMTGGYADSAAVFPSEFPQLKSLVNSGTYGLLQNGTTLTVFFNPFNLNFSAAAESQIDSTGQLNVPGDFFSSVAMRQFVANAMPYTTLINTVYTSAGIPTGEAYGGVIPHGMGSYYPTNISWPAGDPTPSATTVGNVAWWWHEATTVGTPWYDPAAAACTPSTPCKFPVVSVKGATNLDDQANLVINSMNTITGGAVQPYLLDILGSTLASSVGLAPGQGNMPVYAFGWAPDYPDPTDYLAPMYGPDNTYTYTDAVAEQFALPAYNSLTACTQHTSDPTTFAALVYWANLGQVPTACQGFAYTTMTDWMDQAAHLTDITNRTLYYNLVEHIANELALYTYTNQAINVIDYGSWINPAGIDVNPMIGGGGDQLWAFWSYATTTYSATFTESGLPASTNWSVTLGPTTLYSTSSSITFTGVANGTYPYAVSFEPGYTAAPSNGNLTVSGADASASITYSTAAGTPTPLYFNQTGLVSNSTWSVVVQGYGSVSGNGSSIRFDLPASATYTYLPGAVASYQPPAGGSATVATSPVSVNLSYTPLYLPTYQVTFDQTGLPGGTGWSITLGTTGAAYNIASTTSSLSFWETNGTYGVVVHAPSGYVASAVHAKVTVNGDNVTVQVMFTPTASAYTLTFTATGLGASTPWNVSIGNLSVGSTTTTIVFNVGNGTYAWTSSTVPGFIVVAGSKTGSAVVNGSAQGVTVAFMPYTYTVTFFEGGLAAGASWSVTVNGTAQGPTTGYYLAVNLTNGTYPFVVSGPSEYAATPASGNVTVAASGATQVIIFGPIPETFTVTFSTTTLPSGSSWTVYFGSQSGSSTSSSQAFSVVNGTYTYSVVAPNGYTATPGGGTVSVTGTPASQTIVFTKNATAASPSWTYLSGLSYALIGVLALLAVIGFAWAIRNMGRKPPATPPESWSEGSAAGETTGEGPTEKNPKT